MGRILALLLGLGVVAATAYWVVRGNLATGGTQGPSAPKQTLDNVRDRAHQLEDDAQKRANDLAKKTENAE
jgi:hypothetical protein